MIRTNSYSQNWFRFFHADIAEARTIREVDFVCACAPLPGFRKLLDVCCGMGRHARGLASRGYSVTGVERDPGAVAKARELAGGPSYLLADVRDYQPECSAYDVVIIMSQSFGYFDAVTNRHLLGRITKALRKEGRVILDLWNPDFFARHEGERELELPEGIVHENKRMTGSRLLVHLDYPDGGHDDFEWQLFTRGEMNSLAESVGLTLIASCTDFDIAAEPSSSKPRMQFVLGRRTNS